MGILKQLKLQCKDDKLNVEMKNLYLKLNWRVYRSHGFFLSSKRAFFGLVLYPLHCRKRKPKDKFKIVIVKNDAKDPMHLLLNNNSDSLREYWDCFEILRCILTLHFTL